MGKFTHVQFRGTFRSYQQRVLDHADQYLNDGKINIVAAPGSGKTVLGLELIRRLGEPCIILSPTTAIREQWGDRFRDLFLENKEDFPELFSTDLHHVRLINSITYQALYTALEKAASKEDEDEPDCSDVDLFQTIKEFQIKTICLDEAHHLKNEWQKALEKFIGVLDRGVKIISLTATPPYDSEGSEWNRYVNICGEIDEEIFVPELVAQDTLCPHQDYIYFNYPTEEETQVLQNYTRNVVLAVREIAQLGFLQDVCAKINTKTDYEELFSAVKEFVALLAFFCYFEFRVDEKVIWELTAKKGLPTFKMVHAEMAVQFLLDGDLLSEEQKEEIRRILKEHSLYEKRKVAFVLNEKLKRTLVSSVGKLESIGQIAKSEYQVLGSGLRMLVLTDYIKKENVSKIASEETFSSVNVVSIFERLRRSDDALNIGVLSGTLVILPEAVDLSAVKHKKQNIPGTRYCTVDFAGSNHNAVEFVSKLFERGELQILVGTKSLLGEGWDSPCINSLILASFVGSFVLSNQMRGRAIRIDRTNPDKVANIWHLVTVEPEYLFQENALGSMIAFVRQNGSELKSWDFEVLKRRFDSFMGPNYTTGKIESGIERITAIAPPYDKQGIEKINEKMLALSAARQDERAKWTAEVGPERFEVVAENMVPGEKRVPVFRFFNIGFLMVLSAIEACLIQSLIRAGTYFYLPSGILYLTAQTILCCAFYQIGKKILLHFNPARSIKTLGMAVFRTLKACNLISCAAGVEVRQEKELNFVSLYLRNASIHDQNIFNKAMWELLSPIENPRYILIRRNILGKYDYTNSFACPTIIGKKKEYATILAENLKGNTGNFGLVYTHREDGRKMILKCRKKSYITYNQRLMDKKYKVSHWE